MYVFEDKNNQYLNQEVDLRLSELTAQGLIKSEEEYKHVIENTLQNINSDLQRITDVNKYVVRHDDLVSSQQLNSLFVDLTSDLRILHKEMSDIHKAIDITFERNQLFYRRTKNRISAIWKEIQRFRESSFNIESSTYTFFESFSEDSVMYLTGLSIDKKTGTLVLSPGYINSFSDSSEVANVEMNLYPVSNKDGGLVETTAPQNKFEYNYKNGDRTLLKDGLWKVQMLTADIPEVLVDVFGRNQKTSYRGIVAEVDITFVSQKLINEIDIDPYGDFTTRVLSVRYLPDESSTDWLNVTKDNGDILMGSDVDWIKLRNFKAFTAKKLRITFHQPNFQIIHRLMTKVDGMVDKMVTALIEQRFEKINYEYKRPDQFPKYDTSEEADLYDEVMKIIEEGGDITTLESQITNLLVPQPIGIQADISNWKLYNLGAWSINPKNVGYTPQSIGTYISHDPRDRLSGFKMNNGSPMYAKLYTKQEEPSSSSIEWSLMADVDGINYVEIPIVPNNDLWRNESIAYNEYYPLKYSLKKNTNYRNMYNVFKLDFPIHPMYKSITKIMENGKEYVIDDSLLFDYYNSTELYIPTADLTNGSIYSIKYIPAVIDTVKCWTITPNKQPEEGKIDFGNLCVFATKEAAEDMVRFLLGRVFESPVTISDTYSVNFHLCTTQEYNKWFQNGRMNTFIDEVFNDVDNVLSTYRNCNRDYTKLSWLYNDSVPVPYSYGNQDYYSWNNLPSAVPNIKVKRKQY
jgi:hypothetical protein